MAGGKTASRASDLLCGERFLQAWCVVQGLSVVLDVLNLYTIPIGRYCMIVVL